MTFSRREWICFTLAICAVLYVSLRAIPMTGGMDASNIYYGPRLLLHGQNPYNDTTIVAAWKADGASALMRPGLPVEPFLYAPTMAILFAIPALLPWYAGQHAIVLENYLGALLCAVFFYRLASPAWPRWVRLLFIAYVFMLPALIRVLYYGQSTLAVCACLVAALYALSRRRDVLAGVLLALAMAKFTLVLPLLAILAYRRRWKTVGTTLIVFCGVSLLLLMPSGLVSPLNDYRSTVRIATSPDGCNDPGSTHFNDVNTLLNTQRLFFMLCGQNRPLITFLTLGTWLLVILAGFWLLRACSPRGDDILHPLDISIGIMAGLALFYHRYYDLAALMLVIYGVLDYRIRYLQRSVPVWNVTALLLLLLSFGTSETGLSRVIDPIVTRFGILPTNYFSCVLVTLGLVLLGVLMYQDRRLDSDLRRPNQPEQQPSVEP